MNDDTVISYVIELLNDYSMTYQQIAKHLNVSVSSIHKWIDGTRKPNGSVIELVSVLTSIRQESPDIYEWFLRKDK